MSADAKATLRADALARRQAIDPCAHKAAAHTLAQRIFPTAISSDAVVAGYWPIRGELDPRPLMAALACETALPCIAAQNAPLIFRRWCDGDAVQRGALGIMEPLPDAAIVTPNIVLVPLAAFDRRGHRIGYGAGHYDRALGQLRLHGKPIAIGLAFATQEIANVPDEPHDVPLDIVLTENETITIRSA